jgi:tRNA A-37 threonylcarbamoyl transferase component Bud32
VQPTDQSASTRTLRLAVCDRYRAVAVGGFTAAEVARVAAAPEQIVNDPRAFLVKRGRSALVVRTDLTIGGSPTIVAYKRCGSRTRLRQFVRGVRTSAALRNFRLGHRLLQLGIATPRPVIAVSPRWHQILCPSYLATEWIEGAVPLDAFARRAAAWPAARQRAALRDSAGRLGRLIGTLHAQGIAHRDLKSANLIVRERDAGVEVFLVDLDGASRLGVRADAVRLKNLARLHAATNRMVGVTPSLRCRFLLAYLAVFSNSSDWKAVWRQLGKASRIPPRSLRRAG